MRKDKSDDEQELADQIEKIQEQLAGPGTSPPTTASAETFANNTNVNADLQALVLGAAALIEAADLKPNWFQAPVLVYAFLQIMDVPGADT